MGKSAAKLPRGVFETSPGSNKFGIRIVDAYGKRPERVIGTLAETVKAAKEARNERRRSKVLAPEKPEPTFREVADLGIAYAKQRHTHPSRMESKLNYFCQSICDPTTGTTFGDRIADTISKTEIESWLDAKEVEREWSDDAWSTNTKRDYRTAIRISYREAMRLEPIEADPTANIKYRRQPQKEIRNITPEEMDRIIGSIAIPGNRHRTPAFCRKCLAQLETARQTGMRKEEQFSATWEQIDWKRRVLFLPKTKNRHERDAYLNSYVIAILRALQADQTRNGILPTGRIFGIRNPSKWFESTLKYAQIEGVTWHTLRHNFATQLISVNVSVKFVQDLMGHLDYESTARYIHPADEDVMEAIASITDDSVPEYLLNRAYMRATLGDDADSDADVMPAPEPLTEDKEPRQVSRVEAPGDKPELPPRMLTRIPREELYKLVWSEPMTHIAERLGRSSVALGKACDKLNVPVPGRGYWRKVATGSPLPPPPPLPSLPNNPQ